MSLLKTCQITDRLAYLGFNNFGRLGPTNIKRLENHFPDLATAWNASNSELSAAGLNHKIAAAFTVWRASCNPEAIAADLAKEGINYLNWHEAAYPVLLRNIPAAPPLLYYRGDLGRPEANRLAVVGCRKPSAYAEKVIACLLPVIGDAGITIVSGLAVGVDTLAHRLALNLPGRTFAVLGSGLARHRLYPRANHYLADQIIRAGGAVISEFPPDTPPYRQNFPQRNRIIAGLAQATLVIEAGQKSGALITAAQALEQGREVMAIPGNIFSECSVGTNRLIGSGAKMITGAEDVLEIFSLNTRCRTDNQPATDNYRPAAKYQPANAAEAIIYDLLQAANARAETITADQIARKSKLDTSTINSTLSILEIAGIAKNTGSGYDLN
ncbi:MAG: DNA-processing protein DprA [Patescibacteria group bacterium]